MPKHDVDFDVRDGSQVAAEQLVDEGAVHLVSPGWLNVNAKLHPGETGWLNVNDKLHPGEEDDERCAVARCRVRCLRNRRPHPDDVDIVVAGFMSPQRS